MAEIHPNDIGLATFEDVGDVEKLRTEAKKVVDAINELYENGGNASSIGTQFYVDGENNVIIGQNNIVYGSDNLIIGSNNIFVGNKMNIIVSNRTLLESHSLSADSFDAASKRIYVYCYDGEGTALSSLLNVGDKVAVSVYQSWTNSNYDDYASVNSPLEVATITEVGSSYVDLDKLSIPSDPPDDDHTYMEYSYVNTFVPLTAKFQLQGTGTNLSFGGTVPGSGGVAFQYATAKGSTSFAANYGRANGSYSAALCSSTADKSYSFSANTACAYAEYASALNTSYNYNPYGLSIGCSSRIYGRPLKAVSLNTSASTVTLASGENTANLTGKTVVLRGYNSINTILLYTATVSSVSGNTLYLKDVSFGSGSYALTFFPDPYIFVQDQSSSYGAYNFAGGYYGIAAGKYTMAFGLHPVALGEGSTIFGKYGQIADPYSLALANGSSLKAPGLAFKALTDGSVHADGEYTTPCADYAEYFEWEDGNPDAEDRAGYFVKLKGEKIVKCEEFDTPLGIVSAKPAIIGDSGEMHWHGKYVSDDFGRVQYHEVVVPAEKDEEGKILSEEHTEMQPILNPEWDANTEYIPRKNRAEWSPVGVLGKLVVYDDGTLQSGDICRAGADGKAVKSIQNGYPVLKRVSDDKVLIWFKG